MGAAFPPSTLLGAEQHMNEAARSGPRYAAAYSASLGITLLAVAGVANRRWEQVPTGIVLTAAFALCAGALIRRH